MYKLQYEDYQPQHPMLFEPSAGMFGSSKCGIRKAAVDKLIKKVPPEKLKKAGIELK